MIRSSFNSPCFSGSSTPYASPSLIRKRPGDLLRPCGHSGRQRYHYTAQYQRVRSLVLGGLICQLMIF